ncbi:hypothetical protein ACIQVK_50690 [Streptomyces sp. NPDC090493]
MSRLVVGLPLTRGETVHAPVRREDARAGQLWALGVDVRTADQAAP